MKHFLPCRETQCGRRAIYRARRGKRWLTRRSPPCGRRWAWSARRGRGSCLTSCCPVLTTRTTTRLSSTSLTPLRRPVWISTRYVYKPTDDAVPDLCLLFIYFLGHTSIVGFVVFVGFFFSFL